MSGGARRGAELLVMHWNSIIFYPRGLEVWLAFDGWHSGDIVLTFVIWTRAGWCFQKCVATGKVEGRGVFDCVRACGRACAWACVGVGVCACGRACVWACVRARGRSCSSNDN